MAITARIVTPRWPERLLIFFLRGGRVVGWFYAGWHLWHIVQGIDRLAFGVQTVFPSEFIPGMLEGISLVVFFGLLHMVFYPPKCKSHVIEPAIESAFMIVSAAFVMFAIAVFKNNTPFWADLLSPFVLVAGVCLYLIGAHHFGIRFVSTEDDETVDTELDETVSQAGVE